MRSVHGQLAVLAVLFLGLLVLVGSLGGNGTAWLTASASANPIVAENLLPGSPAVVAGDAAAGWDIVTSDANIQGFTTDFSVNHGDVVRFKISVNPAASIRLDIYRMGYYQGNGARKVASISRQQFRT